MVLFLDTRTRAIRFAALSGTKVIAGQRRTVARPEAILPALEQFVNAQAGLSRLRRVVVVSGPGQFSWLRAGVVIGNALGKTLRLPLASVRAADPEQPIPLATIANAPSTNSITPSYGKKPGITIKK